MRETQAWKKRLVRELSRQWPEGQMNPAKMCEVELGLFLLSQVDPAAPAHALWVLLTGYPFHGTDQWSALQCRMVAHARHILPFYKSRYPWERDLEQYRQLDERIRGYDIDFDHEQFQMRQVSLAVGRFEMYEAALTGPLKHQTMRTRWAAAGSYLCVDGNSRRSVDIPPEMIFPPPAQSHDLSGQTARHPLKIGWEELMDTARWMDTRLPRGNYEERLGRVQLEVLRDDQLVSAKTLMLDGVANLIGMVSSGKSTLMEVLAVWATKRGLRVTLVVGDVISALNRAQDFQQMGIEAAPILGTSNRERHANRLHRVLSSEDLHSPFCQEHVGFRWLSTACPLDGLRDGPRPFQAKPCLGLTLDDEQSEDLHSTTTYACPLYNACPTHQAQRDLVTAPIWIATPASLIYTRVAQQINPERLRFAEMVYRCSDLVIVDEADQVQIQLDMAFSPNQTLESPGGDGWLSHLSRQVISQLSKEGRGQLAEERVGAWCHAQDMVQVATSRVYALLLNEAPLRHEIERDYFTAWMLLERVALAMSGTNRESCQDHAGYKRLMSLFADFLRDPLGERGDHELSDFAHQFLAVTYNERVRASLVRWVEQETEVELTGAALERIVVRLECALLVAVLLDRLDLLLRDWRHAEMQLGLDSGSPMLFHRPPEDFLPVVPAAPMGNVLALQYLRSTNQDEAGKLRFFRCMGVGRWLLLHLHDFLAGDGIVGPHVLLLSGTSWAGNSPGYHIQTPVTGVLRAPAQEVAAITASQFRFEPFLDSTGQAIQVSGLRGHARIVALEELLHQLARRSGLGGPSRLEQQRELLEPKRRRIMLLVGSYEEAQKAWEYLERLRPDWVGHIRYLVPDDNEFESQWQGSKSLRRGLVHQFGQGEEWLLIAPLLAVERGHNILNEDNKAALGAVYFLVRPHPRPDDISFAVLSLNHWAVERYAAYREGTLADRGGAFRADAHRRWRTLLNLPMIFSTLPSAERDAVTWNQLVTIWQVIGRLVRGGSAAQVFFCDASFAGRTAAYDEEPEQAATSLLVSIKQVLHPYFAEHSAIDLRERVLVQALYGPFYHAMKNLGGINDAQL